MMNVQDMTELLYMHDAYNELNRVLFGYELLLSYDDGSIGALSRIDNLIERNAAEELQIDDYKEVWKIANDTTIPPEQRAKMLLLE